MQASYDSDKMAVAQSGVPVEHVEDDKEHLSKDPSPLLDEGDDEETLYWNTSTWVNMAALCFAYFSGTFAVTIAPSAIAYIVQSFPTEAANAAWIATSMTMVATIILLPLGEFIDIFGRKWTLLVAMIFGLTGTIVIGRATSLNMVIVGQALNGVGLASGYLIQPIIYEIVPKRHRPLTGALTGVTVGGGFIIAPIIEGACIKAAYGGPLNGWRTGMYIGAAFYGASFLALLIGYSPSPRPLGEGLTTKKRLAKLDWIAIFLLASGLTLFLTGLGTGGHLHPWASASTLCLLIIGLALLVATGVRFWMTPEGLLPHSLFRHRNYATTLVVRCTGSFAQLGCQAYLPQVVVYLFQTDGILQAVWTLPFSLGLIGGAVIAAFIFWKTKEGRWIAIVALGILAVGAGCMTLVRPDWKFVQWMWPPLVIGIAVGCEGQVLNIIAALATPDEYIATAIAATSLSACLGSSIGITIFGQIFTSKFTEFYPAIVGGAVLEAGLPASSLASLLSAAAIGDTEAFANIPGVNEEVLAVLGPSTKVAYADSFVYIWYCLLAFALATMLVALLFKTTVPQMTAKISSPVQENVVSRKLHHTRLDDAEAPGLTSAQYSK